MIITKIQVLDKGGIARRICGNMRPHVTTVRQGWVGSQTRGGFGGNAIFTVLEVQFPSKKTASKYAISLNHKSHMEGGFGGKMIFIKCRNSIISYKLDCLKKCDHQNSLKVPEDVLVSMQISLSVESTIFFTLKTVSKCVITTEALVHMLFLLSKKYYFPKKCLKLCDCLESFKSKIRGGFVATKI